VQHRELHVLRAEIVAPLRHAVRLVDRKQRQPRRCAQALQLREEARHQQPLRRDVQQIVLAGGEAALDRSRRFGRQRRIQERRADAGLAQRRHLVLHQRDQRRDDDAGAVAQQRRNLIAQRLAAAGRHQHQAVAARSHVGDDVLLRPAEGGVAEHILQDGARAPSGSASGWSLRETNAIHFIHEHIECIQAGGGGARRRCPACAKLL